MGDIWRCLEYVYASDTYGSCPGLSGSCQGLSGACLGDPNTNFRSSIFDSRDSLGAIWGYPEPIYASRGTSEPTYAQIRVHMCIYTDKCTYMHVICTWPPQHWAQGFISQPVWTILARPKGGYFAAALLASSRTSPWDRSDGHPPAWTPPGLLPEQPLRPTGRPPASALGRRWPPKASPNGPEK